MERGKSLGFSRVASGTWDVLSRDGGDGASKVVYVQRHQDSCQLARDSLGFSSRHGSAIGTLSWELEAQDPFIPATGIFTFISIFKRSHPSSNFEAFISV